MSPREGKRSRQRYATAAAAVAAGLLAVSACGADGAPSSPKTHASSEPERQTEPRADFKSAYTAGYDEGLKVLDEGGKGAAVREVVHGGCAHRALKVGAGSDGDRGSWVKGCHDGVSAEPKDPPTHPMSKKRENPALLKDFRTWARAKGDEALASRAQQLDTVTLVGPDYDVEVRTDYTSRGQAKNLARTFVAWWDGDDGDGVARSVVVLDAHNRRIAVQSL